MFEMFLNYQAWLPTFAYCSVVQMYLIEFFEVSRKRANLTACILFQVYFVTNAFLILMEPESEITRTSTIQNIYNIYGYFMFDVLYLMKWKPESTTFIVHHMASLILLNTLILLGVKETIQHNILCILLEGTNPFLNLREFIYIYPELKRFNKIVIFYTYLICRIILFPIFTIYFIYNVERYHYFLSIMLIGFYSISLSWFTKILKL